MKRLALVLGTVASAALVLAACGSSAPASIRLLLKSIPNSSNAQFTLTASASGAGMQKATPVLKVLSFKLFVSNPAGASLTTAKAIESSNVELVVYVKGSKALDVRKVGSDVYLEANLTAFSSIPGFPKSAAQSFAQAQALFGGKWFELPSSLVQGLTNKKPATKTKVLHSVSMVEAGAGIVIGYVEGLHHTNISNGYKVTATLNAAANALYAQLRAIDPSISKPTSTQGSFTLTVTGSGSSASGFSLSVTAPNGKKGLATVAFHTGISHNAQQVSAPKGATVITPQLLQEFGLGAKG